MPEDGHTIWRYVGLIVKIGGLIAINLVIMTSIGYWLGGFFELRVLFVIVFVGVGIGTGAGLVYYIIAHTDFTDISRTTEIEIGSHHIDDENSSE